MATYWFDYIIIAVIGLSVLTGLFRGFVKELIALCAWILAFWLAYTYSSVFEHWLEPYVSDKTLRTGISFVTILIGSLFIGGLFNALLSFILKRSGLSGTDRLLGMGFGILRGVFIVALLLTVVKMTSLPEVEYRQQSKLYAKFDPVVNWISGLMPEILKQVGRLDGTYEKTADSLPAKDHQTLSKLEEYEFVEDK